MRELEQVHADGITEPELKSAHRQLKARMIFDNDSVTNIAHQLGYFETIAGADLFLDAGARIENVTVQQVGEIARVMLLRSNRTVGWFDPLPVTSADKDEAV